MDDVEAHVARPRIAHDRVQVGAVVVERPADAVDDRGDLGDVLVEEPERVRVGQHQAGDLVVGLRPQVVEVHPAALVGRHLDHLVAGHGHGRGVGAVGGVGGEHLGPLLAAILVVGAGQEQPGELAVRAGRGLQRDVRQAGDLDQRPLQVPHQLERALGALRVLGRMQARVPGKRRDLLVQARVVLHRARPERVRAGVEVEVAPREPVVVADDLGLGDLGQAGTPGAQVLLRDQLRERRLGHPGGRQGRRAATLDRALVDRGRRVALHRRRHLGGGRRGQRLAHASTPAGSRASPRSAATARPSASANRSMSSFERRSVIATSSPSACSGYSRPSG